jgi:hypothetical protein
MLRRDRVSSSVDVTHAIAGSTTHVDNTNVVVRAGEVDGVGISEGVAWVARM